MTRHASVDTMLHRYGNTVQIHSSMGSVVEQKALLQPLQPHAIPDSDEIGVLCGSRLKDGRIYIGPTKTRLDQFPGETTIIDSDGDRYRVVKSRCCYLGDTPLYIWALLLPVEGTVA